MFRRLLDELRVFIRVIIGVLFFIVEDAASVMAGLDDLGGFTLDRVMNDSIQI